MSYIPAIYIYVFHLKIWIVQYTQSNVVSDKKLWSVFKVSVFLNLIEISMYKLMKYRISNPTWKVKVPEIIESGMKKKADIMNEFGTPTNMLSVFLKTKENISKLDVSCKEWLKTAEKYWN